MVIPLIRPLVPIVPLERSRTPFIGTKFSLLHLGEGYTGPFEKMRYTEGTQEFFFSDTRRERMRQGSRVRVVGLVQKSQYNDLEGTITELSSTGDG